METPTAGASNESRNNRRVSHEQAAIGAACHVPTAPWSLNARRNSINSRLAKGVGVIGGVDHQAASSSRDVAIVTAHPTARDRSSATVGLQGGPIGPRPSG